MKNKLIPPGAGHEVHVWHADLDLPEERLKHAGALLCDEERLRAARLPSVKQRGRFIAAHAALRMILGRYLDLAPENIVIESGENGKPGLAFEAGRPPICFNLSHSSGIALVAVSETRAVGIDVEHVRPVCRMDAICRRFFADREIRVIASAPPDSREELFFQLWTIKEACLKALGEGLRGLKSLSSAIREADGDSAECVPELACLEKSGRSWRVERISTAPGYEAAVALEGDEQWGMVYRRIEPVFRKWA